MVDSYLEAHTQLFEAIRKEAWDLHKSAGQFYDNTLPYGHHLSMVADMAKKYLDIILAKEEDIVPVVFAAYFHDSIEDARQSYNDVTKTAKKYMNDEQAFMAAEIVFALTNEKGRTRKERANNHYYEGIRNTPYAPFVKLCDRMANVTYSISGNSKLNNRMHEVYRSEWPLFIEKITSEQKDLCFQLPKEMIDDAEKLIMM